MALAGGQRGGWGVLIGTRSLSTAPGSTSTLCVPDPNDWPGGMPNGYSIFGAITLDPLEATCRRALVEVRRLLRSGPHMAASNRNRESS